MAVGIATFGPGTTTGIPLSGNVYGGVTPAPGATAGGNQTPSAGASILVPGGGVVEGALTTTPNSLLTGSGSYGGSTATAASTADVAAYQDEINALNQLLGLTDSQQQNGVNSINQGYGNSLAQLDGNHTNSLNQYDTQRTQAKQGYSKNVDAINNNARNGYNSLQSLLAGTGSAGEILAPLAVSQQANSQRGGAADTFANNQLALQNAANAEAMNYSNSKKSLEGQKNDQLSKLLASIDQQKIGYQQQLAQANNQLNIARGGGYQTQTANNNAITDLLNQMKNLPSQFAQPTFSASDYVAPNVDVKQFQAQAAQLGGLNNQPDTGQTDTAAALAALLKQNQNANQYQY